jgi:hypothetical protein
MALRADRTALVIVAGKPADTAELMVKFLPLGTDAHR